MAKRKMKRAYMKTYSSGYINPGPTPNKGVLAQYHTSAKGLSIPKDSWLNAIFPGVNSLDTPEKICAKVAQGHPRAIVLAKLFQGTQRGQKEQPVNYISVLKCKSEEIRLYISSDMCFFIRRLIRGPISKVWLSLTYPTAAQAKRDWGYQRVPWVEPPLIVETPHSE